MKRKRTNFVFSSKMVRKDNQIKEHIPTIEEKESRNKAKSLFDLILERKRQNPIKFWRNRVGELCFASMKTAQGIKI